MNHPDKLLLDYESPPTELSSPLPLESRSRFPLLRAVLTFVGWFLVLSIVLSLAVVVAHPIARLRGLDRVFDVLAYAAIVGVIVVAWVFARAEYRNLTR